jgi:hypothetical protein
MNWHGAQLNLFLAWFWIVAGFVSGFFFGLFFHKENWLGGYASFKRRLYRLAHISFFGLASINFLFYLTARNFNPASVTVTVASWGFVLGAISMPVCCLAMAHRPRLRALFLIPVVSLITAGILTLWEIIKL